MKTKNMKALSANELRNINGGYGYDFITDPDGRPHIEDIFKIPGIDSPFDIGRPPIFI
jgi:hypothetical protein